MSRPVTCIWGFARGDKPLKVGPNRRHFGRRTKVLLGISVATCFVENCGDARFIP
jgi:hypothetical protein